jgi:hypothetical protein
VLVPLLAGLALTALFVAHALRSDHPLLDLRLFANRAFAAAAATTFVLGAALFGALIIVPLYYQGLRGRPRSPRACCSRRRGSAPRWPCRARARSRTASAAGP